MSQTQVFARLAKVDEAKRQVTGIIASETPDHAREVFDYDTSKPHFEKWSGDVAKASDGKSVGNVRAMHGKVAAGRLTDITFDDVAKSIEVVADIVDDNEWEKVLKGVYTGFSIGGKYVKKWADTVNKSLKRYTAAPNEVSLVDMGCNPNATFALSKADGSEEQVAFIVPGQEELLAKMADPEASEVEKRDALIQLSKGYGVNIVPVDDEEGGDEEELTKGAYSIGQLARLAEDVQCLLNSSKWSGYEGDGVAAISAELKKAAEVLLDGLLKMVAVDVEAAKKRIKEVVSKMDEEGELAKVAGSEELTKANDALAATTDTLNKVMSALGVEEGTLIEDVLAKINEAQQATADLQKKLDTETSEHAETKAELEKVKGEPAPAKGAVKAVPVAVGKEHDASGGGNVAKVDAQEPEVKDPLALVKAAHASGGRVLMSGSFTDVNGQ